MLSYITTSIYRITKWKEEYVQFIYTHSFKYNKSKHVKCDTNINHQFEKNVEL